MAQPPSLHEDASWQASTKAVLDVLYEIRRVVGAVTPNDRGGAGLVIQQAEAMNEALRELEKGHKLREQNLDRLQAEWLGERSQRQGELQNLEQNIAAEQAKLCGLHGTVQTLKTEEATAKSNLDELQKKQKAEDQKLNQARNGVKQIEKRYADRDELLRKREITLGTREDAQRKNSDKLIEEKQQYARKETEWSRRTGERTARLEQLDRQVQEKEANLISLANCEAGIETLRNEKISLQQTTADLSGKLERKTRYWHGRNNELASKNEELEKMHSETSTRLETTIKQLENTVEQQASELAQVRSTSASMKTELQRKHDDLTQLYGQIAAQDIDSETARNYEKELGTQISYLEDKIRDLEGDQMPRIDAELKIVQALAYEKASELDTVRRSHDELSTQVQRLQEEIQTKDCQLASQQSQIETQAQQMGNLQTSGETLSQEVTMLTTGLSERESIIQEYEVRIQGLQNSEATAQLVQEENARLLAQLTDKEIELKAAHEIVAGLRKTAAQFSATANSVNKAALETYKNEHTKLFNEFREKARRLQQLSNDEIKAAHERLQYSEEERNFYFSEYVILVEEHHDLEERYERTQNAYDDLIEKYNDLIDEANQAADKDNDEILKLQSDLEDSEVRRSSVTAMLREANAIVEELQETMQQLNGRQESVPCQLRTQSHAESSGDAQPIRKRTFDQIVSSSPHREPSLAAKRTQINDLRTQPGSPAPNTSKPRRPIVLRYGTPWAIEDVLNQQIAIVGIPANIVRQLREHIRKWDDRGSAWRNAGKRVCARMKSLKKKNNWEHGAQYACAGCTEGGTLCCAVLKRSIELLPVWRRSDEATLRPEDEGFWLVPKERS